MRKDISVKELNEEAIDDALSLVWNVFNKYEGYEYTKEGIEEFYKSIHDKEYLSRLRVFGAFEKEKLIGVIATRNEGTHIALFFVDAEYHRQGIGKKLFSTVLKENHTNKMTVNSAPYAIPVYHKLGFYDTDKEQVVNGLRYTPMELKL